MTRPTRLVIVSSFALVAAGAIVVGVTPLPRTAPPLPRSSANKVTSFAHDHPEFGPLRDGRIDASPLVFTHARHMSENVKGWKGEDRPMTCTDCHAPDGERRLMKPIRYEAHCQFCHGLRDIDAAEGNVKPVPAPHGSPEALLEIVDSQLNQWIAQSRAIEAPKPAEPAPGAGTSSGDQPKPAEAPAGPRGRRPGAGAKAETKKAELPKWSSAEDVAAFFTSQRAKVLKKFGDPKAGACAKCHQVESGPAGGPFTVAHPNTPSRWFAKATFTHGSHEMIGCVECHSTSKESSRTSDVNLPGIESCRKCHSPSGGAASACVTCHVYHQRSDRPPDGRLTADQLLNRKPASAPQAGAPASRGESQPAPSAPAQTPSPEPQSPK